MSEPAPQSFEELVDRRHILREAERLNNADLESVLVGIYADPIHFLYELLQNAEDAGASEVAFGLYPDRLTVTHDGRAFTLPDVDAITNIGASTKKGELTTLGRFGIGFKSVFSVTNTPVIRSGEFHFRIEDLYVPVRLTGETRDDQTVIVLPFNPEAPKPHEAIRQRLRTFGADSLLFLESVKTVRWSCPGDGEPEGEEPNDGEYRRDAEILAAHVRLVTVASADSESAFVCFRQPIDAGGSTRSVAVAYRVETNSDGGEEVVPEPDAPLSVFFPTEKPTYLSFRTQAPFRTTPNRENVPLDAADHLDIADNLLIADALASVAASSVVGLRELGLLTLDVIEQLPLQPLESRGVLYEKVQDAVAQVLARDAVWPTSEGEFATADDVAIAATRELADLLSADDLDAAAGRRAWLPEAVSRLRTPGLWKALTSQLGVPEVRWDTVVGLLDETFLAAKKDAWVIDLYRAVGRQERLWRRGRLPTGATPALLQRPFVRTESGRHICPFVDGRPQVHLPPDGETAFEVVRRFVAADGEARDFLARLGLSEPGLLAEVTENVLPLYTGQSHPPLDDYPDHLRAVVRAYEVSEGSDRGSLLELLRTTPFVLTEGPDGDSFVTPDEAYFGSDDLRAYFAGQPTRFVAPRSVAVRGARELLRTAGVAGAPRRLLALGTLSPSAKQRLRNGESAKQETVEDFSYDGLELFLSRPLDPDDSHRLWGLLCRSIREHTAAAPSAFFRGAYSYMFYTRRTKWFDASFVRLLNDSPWLFGESLGPARPHEMRVSDLDGEYDTTSPAGEALVQRLAFRPDAVDQLPPDARAIFDATQGMTPADVEEALDLYRRKQKKTDAWTPTVPAEQATPVVGTFEGKAQAASGEPENTVSRGFGGGARGYDGKAVGDWGERVVRDVLAESEAVEVRWLNASGEKGGDHDIEVVVDGEITEYIEVKSTRETGDVVVALSAPQWRLATRLEDIGGPATFVLYVVRGAGETDAVVTRVASPVRLLRAGSHRRRRRTPGTGPPGERVAAVRSRRVPGPAVHVDPSRAARTGHPLQVTSASR